MSDSSEWTTGEQPEYNGLYLVQRGFKQGIWYSYWNGEFWGMTEETAQEAIASAQKKSVYQDLPWRSMRKVQK